MTPYKPLNDDISAGIRRVQVTSSGHETNLLYLPSCCFTCFWFWMFTSSVWPDAELLTSNQFHFVWKLKLKNLFAITKKKKTMEALKKNPDYEIKSGLRHHLNASLNVCVPSGVSEDPTVGLNRPFSNALPFPSPQWSCAACCSWPCCSAARWRCAAASRGWWMWAPCWVRSDTSRCSRRRWVRPTLCTGRTSSRWTPSPSRTRPTPSRWHSLSARTSSPTRWAPAVTWPLKPDSEMSYPRPALSLVLSELVTWSLRS